jgi:putative redox protein
MVTIEIEYQGELHTQAVHGPSKTQLFTDAPVDNGGKGEAFSPTDLVATALGSCMLTTMGIFAARHEIDLRGARATVSKHMIQQPVRRIGRLEVDLHLPLPSTHPYRVALEKAALTCPVHQSLHPDVSVPIAFHYGAEAGTQTPSARQPAGAAS